MIIALKIDCTDHLIQHLLLFKIGMAIIYVEKSTLGMAIIYVEKNLLVLKVI